MRTVRKILPDQIEWEEIPFRFVDLRSPEEVELDRRRYKQMRKAVFTALRASAYLYAFVDGKKRQPLLMEDRKVIRSRLNSSFHEDS